MLGKLAKWLRILGFDTLYYNEIDDDRLLAIAEKENRILLTRDTRIKRMKKAGIIFIEDDHWREQLKQFLKAFPVEKSDLFSRCLICNRELLEIKKEKVKEKVPPYVYQSQENFSCCPGCGKIYWSATHYERMRDELVNLGVNDE